MSSQVITPNTEAAILARLMQARDSMSPEVAQYLLSIDFDVDDTARMNVLAERAREGTLTPEARTLVDLDDDKESSSTRNVALRKYKSCDIALFMTLDRLPIEKLGKATIVGSYSAKQLCLSVS
jgi:hypothetical protein